MATAIFPEAASSRNLLAGESATSTALTEVGAAPS